MTFHTKHFKLVEARQTLLRATPLVEEMIALKASLDEHGLDVRRHPFFGGAGPNGERYFPRELERLVEILGELDGLGIQIKNIDQGLIDFPHLRASGEEVYLCHLAGEPDIDWWHPLEIGFAGRRPVSEL